jgi:hypothetical protein
MESQQRTLARRAAREAEHQPRSIFQRLPLAIRVNQVTYALYDCGVYYLRLELKAGTMRSQQEEAKNV